MINLAHRVILAFGYQRWLLAFLSGGAGALAMPPVDFFPALFVSMSFSVWLLDGATAGSGNVSFRSLVSAAVAGWWFGFGYFLAGLWWLGAAFLADAGQFLWAMPLGVVVLPAALAVFHAAGFACARLFWSNRGGRIFALGLGLGGADWLRGHVFTGFPWNPFGQAFADYLIPAQMASLIGVEGLSVLAILIAATPALIGTGETWPRRYRGIAAAALALALIAGFGWMRLARNGGLLPQIDAAHLVAGVRLRVMQPNIPLFEKHRSGEGARLLESYLKLSDRASSPLASGLGDATHLIWPESPFPFVLAQEPQALRMISEALQGHVTLVTGAIRGDQVGAGGRPDHFYNAIQIVGQDGTILDSYDKVHLVPFGEYVPAPFKWLIAKLGLTQFVPIPGGFDAGTVYKPLSVPGLPAAMPLICYEAVFPTQFLDARAGAGVMINLTNDGWFGASFGPYQHFSQSRMRTIEQGLPLIRSANTGISAVIDPFGRILKALPLNVADIIDAPLPRAIPPTFYCGLGRFAVFALLLVCAYSRYVLIFGGPKQVIVTARL